VTRVPATGGVAFWAHASGFIIGAAAALVLGPAEPGPGRVRAGRPAPAAARLVTALADGVAFLLLARFFLVMFSVQAHGFGQVLLKLPFALTGPLTTPFAEFAPPVRLGRVELELPSLAAAAAFHLLGWAVTVLAGLW